MGLAASGGGGVRTSGRAGLAASGGGGVGTVQYR